MNLSIFRFFDTFPLVQGLFQSLDYRTLNQCRRDFPRTFSDSIRIPSKRYFFLAMGFDQEFVDNIYPSTMEGFQHGFISLPFNIIVRAKANLSGRVGSRYEFQTYLRDFWHRPVIRYDDHGDTYLCFVIEPSAITSEQKEIRDADFDPYYFDSLLTPHGYYYCYNLDAGSSISLSQKHFESQEMFRELIIQELTNHNFEIKHTADYGTNHVLPSPILIPRPM